MAAVRTIREFGYTMPVTVMGNQYGRDLPSIVARGPSIFASDPQIIFGWQAYWGNSGWYQSWYGMTLAEGIQQSATQPFPVQVGLTSLADPGDPLDYQAALTEAHRAGVGWLWWNWSQPPWASGRSDPPERPENGGEGVCVSAATTHHGEGPHPWGVRRPTCNGGASRPGGGSGSPPGTRWHRATACRLGGRIRTPLGHQPNRPISSGAIHVTDAPM
jgi:hypothetical protein